MLARTCTAKSWDNCRVCNRKAVWSSHLAHAVRGLARQINLVQAEEVVAVFALLAAARAQHEDVARVRLVIQRISVGGAVLENDRFVTARHNNNAVLWLLVLSEGEHADLSAPYLALDGDAGVWHAHDEREFTAANPNFRHGHQARNGHLPAVAGRGCGGAAGGVRLDDGIKHGAEPALLQPPLHVAHHLWLAVLVAVVVGGFVGFKAARRHNKTGGTLRRSAGIFAGRLSDAGRSALGLADVVGDLSLLGDVAAVRLEGAR